LTSYLSRSRDEQQLAGGGAALHVGMRLRRVSQRVDAADPDLQPALADPVVA
jgi:hypothetical protein